MGMKKGRLKVVKCPVGEVASQVDVQCTLLFLDAVSRVSHISASSAARSSVHTPESEEIQLILCFVSRPTLPPLILFTRGIRQSEEIQLILCFVSRPTLPPLFFFTRQIRLALPFVLDRSDCRRPTCRYLFAPTTQPCVPLFRVSKGSRAAAVCHIFGTVEPW